MIESYAQPRLLPAGGLVPCVFLCVMVEVIELPILRPIFCPSLWPLTCIWHLHSRERSEPHRATYGLHRNVSQGPASLESFKHEAVAARTCQARLYMSG